MNEKEQIAGKIETLPGEIKDWEINEAATLTARIGADDGPSFMYPSHDIYKRASTKDLEKYIRTGWTIVSHLMDDGTEEDIQFPPNFPQGRVKAVSFFPAGDVDNPTPANQEDLFGMEAWNKWRQHILNTIAKVGWEWIEGTADEEDRDIAVKDAEGAKQAAEPEKKKKADLQKKIEESVNEVIRVINEGVAGFSGPVANTLREEVVTQINDKYGIYNVDIDGEEWFIRKIDGNHFYLANNEKALAKDHPNGALARHIGEFRGTSAYDNIRKWLRTTNENNLQEGIGDFLYLKDQLENAMEYYRDKKEFATHISNETGYSKRALERVYDAYWEIPVRDKMAFGFTKKWDEWLKQFGITESVDEAGGEWVAVDDDTGKLIKKFKSHSAAKRWINKQSGDSEIRSYENWMKTYGKPLFKGKDVFKEAATKKFSAAAETYQRESVELQRLKDDQQKLINKFKNSKGDSKEKLKDALIKMHKKVKKQQKIVDRAEENFERAIRDEPEELEEAVANILERLSLSAKNPKQKEAILSLLPVNLEHFSEYKREFIDMLNKFYKSHGIPAEIKEARDLSAKEVAKKFKKGDKVKFKGPDGVVTDTIEKVDGIYLKLKKSGTIPYQGVIDEASSTPGGRRKVVDWIQSFNNAVVIGVKDGFIKFKATNFAYDGIERELKKMGIGTDFIKHFGNNEYGINMKDRTNYLDFLSKLNEDVNEGIGTIRKIVKRARKLGIDNWKDLEDLVRDEFPRATGADFTFAKQELLGENMNESIEKLKEAKKMKTISKKEWDKLHRDFKGERDGQKYITTMDKKTGGTISIPVKVESINETGNMRDDVKKLLDKGYKGSYKVEDDGVLNFKSDKVASMVTSYLNQNGIAASHKDKYVYLEAKELKKLKELFTESIDKEAINMISKYTNIRDKAVEKFLKKHNIDGDKALKLAHLLKKGSLSDRLDFGTAVIGKDSNRYADKVKKMVGESINEAVQPSDTIQQVLDIVDERQRAKVNGQYVDLTTANIIRQVWEKASDSNKQKLNQLDIRPLINLAYKAVK